MLPRCRRSNPKTNSSRLTLESPTRIPAFWLTPKVPKVVAKPPTREAPIVVDDLTVCPDGFLLQGNTLLIPCGQNTTLTPSFRGSVYAELAIWDIPSTVWVQISWRPSCRLSAWGVRAKQPIAGICGRQTAATEAIGWQRQDFACQIACVKHRRPETVQSAARAEEQP